MALIFHRLVQKDLRAVLRYYEEEGGAPLADRFFAELDGLIGQIASEPRKFHFVAPELRRANMARFALARGRYRVGRPHRESMQMQAGVACIRV